MLLGSQGGQVYFEIRIHKRNQIDGIQALIHDEIQVRHHFQVEMITTGENLDICIRDTLTELSTEGYRTRKEALEAAAEFIEDYKTKLKQQTADR